MTAWIFSLLVYLAAPEKMAALPAFPGWAETAEQRTARYQAIARDIAAVTKNPHDAAALVAVSYMESAWAPDVDKGPCYRPTPKSPRCDGGASVSAYQIRIGSGTTVEGWTKDDLQQDRLKATMVALRMIRQSVAACSKYGPDALLAAYTSGSCGSGRAASKARMELARRLLSRFPPPASPKPSE